jgi:hypothetical protein
MQNQRAAVNSGYELFLFSGKKVLEEAEMLMFGVRSLPPVRVH